MSLAECCVAVKASQLATRCLLSDNLHSVNKACRNIYNHEIKSMSKQLCNQLSLSRNFYEISRLKLETNKILGDRVRLN